MIMRTHSEIGYNMLTRIPFLRDAAEIVLAHHEFFDGTGYPRQLRGEQIPLGARVISVANALDAMLSDRPYRNALPMSHAREEIRRCAGTQFDPKIVEVFLSIPENHWIELRENMAHHSASLTLGIWRTRRLQGLCWHTISFHMTVLIFFGRGMDQQGLVPVQNGTAPKLGQAALCVYGFLRTAYLTATPAHCLRSRRIQCHF